MSALPPVLAFISGSDTAAIILAGAAAAVLVLPMLGARSPFFRIGECAFSSGVKPWAPADDNVARFTAAPRGPAFASEGQSPFRRRRLSLPGARGLLFERLRTDGSERQAIRIGSGPLREALIRRRCGSRKKLTTRSAPTSKPMQPNAWESPGAAYCVTSARFATPRTTGPTHPAVVQGSRLRPSPRPQTTALNGGCCITVVVCV